MTIKMRRGDFVIFGLIGFGVWISGAIMFRVGGRLMFDSGPWILVATGVGIAVSVCLLLNAVMAFRKAPRDQSLVIAVAMALPGLFGDVGYILAFNPITGLSPTIVGPFAAVVVFGNAILLAYAMARTHRS